MYRLAPSFFASRVFRAAPDRRDLITKLVRELNFEVTQPADPKHRNKVTRERTTVA